MKLVVSVFRSFLRDDCLHIAAHISFCAILAIIPIGMMMVAITGYFLGGEEGEAFGKVVAFVGGVLPMGMEPFVENLRSITDQRSSLGLVGIGFLIFIATILTSSVESALDTVFKTERKRNFLHSRLLGIAMIVLVTILLSLPTMVQIFDGLFHRFGFGVPLGALMTDQFFFFVIAFLAFMLTVVIVPNQNVHFRYAVVGAVFFAIGIGVAKLIFRWYMDLAIHRYNLIYGSLTAVMLVLIWIYYLSAVALLAAELVAGLQARMVFHRRVPEEEPTLIHEAPTGEDEKGEGTTPG